MRNGLTYIQVFVKYLKKIIMHQSVKLTGTWVLQLIISSTLIDVTQVKPLSGFEPRFPVCTADDKSIVRAIPPHFMIPFNGYTQFVVVYYTQFSKQFSQHIMRMSCLLKAMRHLARVRWLLVLNFNYYICTVTLLCYFAYIIFLIVTKTSTSTVIASITVLFSGGSPSSIAIIINSNWPLILAGRDS